MQNYQDQIQNLVDPTFQQIRKIAINSISHLSRIQHDELYYRLKRGLALLNTHEEMCQYLVSYGNMHEAKIRDAVSILPNQLFQNEFEIVDWGCGQGIGTVCFFDYLKTAGYTNRVKTVTLIEPSQKALSRASLHVNSYLNDNTEIITISKYLDDIKNEDIRSRNDLPVIHFFSNILDIEEIDLKELAAKIDKSVIDDNYIISVGPLNPNNKRIDAFYNYYIASILYDYENSQYNYGGYSTCTYKAKVYKLEFNEQGNLIPIEFYPSVQFHAAYQLDGTTEVLQKSNNEQLNTISKNLTVFETSTPFDIGANVYDDIHPILAVLNNIITRGLPTKASPFVENIFKKTFKYAELFVKYGTFSYPNKKNVDYEKLILWYNALISNQTDLDYNEIDIEQLQLIFSPIAIARVQKTILEALMTGKLDINSKKWDILVEEKDVPCAAIAFADLSQIFNNLTKLSSNYQTLVFPEVKLDIISNEFFLNSDLHLDNKTFQRANPTHLRAVYDLVIDISIFETPNIKKDSFSKFQSRNNCYFNIRSAKEINSERCIYTSDKIQYQDFWQAPPNPPSFLLKSKARASSHPSRHPSHMCQLQEDSG